MNINKKGLYALITAGILTLEASTLTDCESVIDSRLLIKNAPKVKVETEEDVYVAPFIEGEEVSIHDAINNYYKNNIIFKSCNNNEHLLENKINSQLYLNDNLLTVKNSTYNKATLVDDKGKELYITSNKDLSYTKFKIDLDNDKYVEYEISIGNLGYNYYETNKNNYNGYNKYYISYDDNKEFLRGFVYRKNDELLFSCSIMQVPFERKLNISSKETKASFKISKDEYKTLKNSMKNYDNINNNLKAFLINNDLLNNYLEEIKEKDINTYNEIINNIDLLINEEKILKK